MKLRKILAVVVAVAMVASLAISASANTKTLAGQAANTSAVVLTGTITGVATATNITLASFGTVEIEGMTAIPDAANSRINGQLPNDGTNDWNVVVDGLSQRGQIAAQSGSNMTLNISVRYDVSKVVDGDGEVINENFGKILTEDDLKDVENVGGTRAGVLSNAKPVATSATILSNIFNGLSVSEKVEIAKAGGAVLELTVEAGHANDAVRLTQKDKTVAVAIVGSDSKASLTVPASAFADIGDGYAIPNGDAANLNIKATSAKLAWGDSVVDGVIVEDGDEEPGTEEDPTEEDPTEDPGENWDAGDLVPADGPTTDLGGDGDEGQGGLGGEGEDGGAGAGSNPGTGVALAIVPALVAGAAVVVARKRK